MPMLSIDTQFPEHSGLPGYIWYTAHSCAIIGESLSILGSCYIFYMSMICYRRGKLTPMRFLPLMISVGDFLYAILHGSDHMHALDINKGPSGDICYMFGLFLWVPWNICLCASMATAWYTHQTITTKQSPKVGKYYWKMILPVFLGAFIPPVVATLTGMTAPNGFYCDLQGWFTLYQIVANNITLATLIFFYVRSFICLKEHVGELMALSYKRMQNPFELSITKMENVMHKLGSYLLIQIFLLAWADLYSALSFTIPDITQWYQFFI
eukprot:NODE_62_length_26495_cov_0.832853.p12 type:complete len:268 gc:universal NODE_62_length_26495_cov_0.832853:24879-24076(-)